jgi:hypothetical protein
MYGYFLSSIVATTLGMAIGATQAVAQLLCRPALTINDVHFSPRQPPTLERRWSAMVSVEASQCALASSGSFEIVFLRLKETAPTWNSASVSGGHRQS